MSAIRLPGHRGLEGSWHLCRARKREGRSPGEGKTGLGKRSTSADADRLGLARAHPLGSLADGWQQAGDERIFKIILSPEDATVDFQRIAKDMIARIEQHTGASVEWGGVVHRNTDHPHAHVLMRGKMPSGEPLRLPAALIRGGCKRPSKARSPGS